MPRDPGDPPMIQCRKCGRAVWSNHVNSRGNCSLCSPVRAESDTEPEPDAVAPPAEEPAAPAEASSEEPAAA